MIKARCLPKSHWLARKGHSRVHLSTPLQPRFASSRVVAASSTALLRKASPSQSITSTLLRWPLPLPLGPAGVRLASTGSSKSSDAENQSESFPTSDTSNPTDGESWSDPFDVVTSSASPPVYDEYGFLKEMGLDYGWGFTASMEWLLEHIHILAGTPWWASIGLTVAFARVCCLPMYFTSADTSARNMLIQEYNKPIMERLKAAQANKDINGITKASKEIADLRKSAGIKTWKMLIPFIQIPITFGMFRLMRGMSYLPVPGLDTGGLLWMQDLTLSDPYFILPVVTSAAYWYAFKSGGDTGNNAAINPAIRTLFLYIIPPFSCIFMVAWPGALQLVLFFQATITLLQSSLLRQNWFRGIIGIQPIPKPQDIKPSGQAYSGKISKPITINAAPKPQGIFGGAKATYQSATAALRKQVQDQRQKKTDERSPAELQHAKAYDQKRERELAQERFEQQQERAAKRAEKAERRAQR